MKLHGKQNTDNKQRKITTKSTRRAYRLADSITASNANYVSEQLAMYFYSTGKQ